MDADKLIDRLIRIVLAEPSKLSAHRLGPCRYCYGIDHEFQWKTEREFREALNEAKSKLPLHATAAQKALLPSAIGGFGYRITDEPAANCPECAGLGTSYVWFADTSKLSRDELLLFESVEETKYGKRLHLLDRLKVFEMLARHLGILKNSVKPVHSDGLTELLMEAQGTTLTVGTSNGRRMN